MASSKTRRGSNNSVIRARTDAIDREVHDLLPFVLADRRASTRVRDGQPEVVEGGDLVFQVPVAPGVRLPATGGPHLEKDDMKTAWIVP
jgi:hypothetical protein